jgi:hypothetical protein
MSFGPFPADDGGQSWLHRRFSEESDMEAVGTVDDHSGVRIEKVRTAT